MNQPALFPPTARLTTVVRAMALSDPAWQTIEPKRELVFPVGAPPSNDEREWAFTSEDLAGIVAEFGQRAEPAPVLYRHGEDPARGGMAAGWIDRVELADDGLYAYIRYTERALSEIRDGAWGYRSPGFDAEQDEAGAWHPRRLSEVSLVNDPAIAGMPPIKAQSKAAAVPPAESTEAASTDAPTTPRGAQEEQSMGDSQTVTAAKKQKSAAFDKPGLLGMLRETYAMPEAVSDEMLVKMLMEALAGAPEPDEMEMEKDADKPSDAPAIPVEVPAAASVQPTIVRVESIEDVKAEAEKNARVIAAVQKAARLGTITPATLDAAGKLAIADIDSFEKLFCSPPAPAAGQLITASAKDRSAKPATYADQIRAQRNAAIGVARQ